MTVKAYIEDKLRAFGPSDARLADVTISGVDLDADVGEVEPSVLGFALIDIVEELVFAPRQDSINESGFSMSWDFSGLSNWYRWLCRKWGRKPDDEVLEMMGLSVIRDRSSKW